MRFILDANVVVSALIAAGSESPPRRLLHAVRIGVVTSVASAELMAERRAVAVRPRVLRYIRKSADETLRAIKDAHLWDLLHSDRASLLVTGDGPLLTEPLGPGRVITPRDAVDRLAKAGHSG